MRLVLILSLIMGVSAQAAKRVKVDGSSTVFPITEAVAEEFGKVDRSIRVTVGKSGTGGGFKRFLNGETDINNASREIKKKEMAKAKEKGIDYMKVPVALDGITVVVNKANTWIDYLTPEELHKMWKPGSKVKTWKDVRASWPAEKILLYGPGADSGTFDFFTEAINGKSQRSRADYTMSEEDNILVRGVAGDKNALGYFGFAYYEANKDKLKAVPIKAKAKKAIMPTQASINSGEYSPLSRKIYIYVSKKAAKRPEVGKFVNFYIEKAGSVVPEVGYVALSQSEYQKASKAFKDAIK